MENKEVIRCLIVDDEHPAIRLLSGYIKKTPGLELALQTTHPLEALAFIKKGLADLVFADVQMPDLTGIELIDAIKENQIKVILTTAYEEYALKSYEYDVIDYLLKPITFDRFSIAAAKAKQRILPSLPVFGNDYIMLKTEYRLQRVDFSTIFYIEALGDYVIFYTTLGKVMTLQRMKNMEELLPKDFLRIHKSYIVNINRIDFFEKGKIVINKKQLPVGETYKSAVKLKFGL